MAAEVLAQGGADVTVYDAMPSAGRKFLMAGRGGLNLTHSEPLPQFLARYREATPHLKAAIEAFPPAACATGARRWGRKPLSAPAAGFFRKPSRPRPCCGRGCGGWTRWVCDWRCATAGPAGTSRAACVFKRRMDRTSSRRARRCWRSAAQAGRGWAPTAHGSKRSSREAYRYRRCARPIPASPSPGRTSFATASKVSRSRAWR